MTTPPGGARAAGSGGTGRHVVLVGMMGSGKTTVGRQVAERLGLPLSDSDAEVEARTGRTVAEIFAAEGEPAFRSLERSVLVDVLAQPTPVVVAAAGGVVLDPANRAALAQAGLVVWLRADPAVLATRVVGGTHRPLLAEDPAGTLARLDAERADLYAEVADLVVDVGERTPDQVADAVVEAYRDHARAAGATP